MTTTSADIPLLVISAHSSSERRVNPSWTISNLKARLEPITGIPASNQKLSLKIASQSAQPIEAIDETSKSLAEWPLQAYAEIHVADTRPPGARENYTDTSNVEKFSLPIAEYEARTDSVLAWKKSHKLGRFDPNAPHIEQEKAEASLQEVEIRGLRKGLRCRLLPSTDHRRGAVAYVGAVPEIAGGLGSWVGVKLDEPSGKNDGTVNGKEYFTCGKNYGVFVRPERVEVGDFSPLGLDDEMDEDEEF